MARIKSRKGLASYFAQAPIGVQKVFNDLPKLTDNMSLTVPLAYLFARVEAVHVLTLYCGLVKLHKTNADMTWNILQHQHITRKNFQDFFANIIGKSLNNQTRKLLEKAEKVRDKVIHGKRVNDAEKRDALAWLLDYAKAFDSEVFRVAKFHPFGGDLRGFKGAGKSFPKRTTRWILKGMGFGIG